MSLLRQNWYTQNYVGEFFLPPDPGIASATGKKLEFVRAIRVAVANDARLIVRKIDDLPLDWVEDIRADE